MKELTRLHQLTIFVSAAVMLSRSALTPQQLVNSATTTTSSTAGIPISSLPVREHTKPLLGPSFTYLSDLTLWTTKADSIWGSDGRGKFIVEVARNRRGESRGWACFDLVGSDSVVIGRALADVVFCTERWNHFEAGRVSFLLLYVSE